jgi:GTPase SAR1 family protein
MYIPYTNFKYEGNCLTFFCLLCMCVINLVGKTTLRKGLVRCLAHGSTFSKIFLTPMMDFLSKLKDGLRQTQRTHGIEIRELKVREGVNLSIWDMAGQEEFHAFHDFMLPNLDGTSYPSLFLLVCSPFKHVQGSPNKAIQDIQEELDYWLRFIASKNRQSIIFKPKAIVVFTHSDKIDVNPHAPGIVRNLKKKFAKVVDVALEPITIDSHSSQSARLVVKLIQENVEDLLNKLPCVYKVCIAMRLALKAWMSKHPDSPLMDQDTFSKLCQKTMLPKLVKSDQSVIKVSEDALIKLNEDRNKAVAKCLHTSGDIIFFEDLDFVVVDVDWFCHQVMGHLIKLSHDQVHVTNRDRHPLTNKHGFTTKECLQHFLDASTKSFPGRKLQNVQTKQLMQLMLRLELCFEGTCGSLEDGLFIPATLASRNKTSHSVLIPWEWQPISRSLKKPIYFGRRLQCDDQACTFIPPGFFCRLQVRGTYVNLAYRFCLLINFRKSFLTKYCLNVL